MILGIAGASKSGKTTIFNAITGLDAGIGLYDVKSEPNIGMVQVLDERVTRLSELYKPKKTIYATVEFLDFPGMIDNTENHEFLSNTAMNLIRTTDALVIVLRNFSELTLDETFGMGNPEKELKSIVEEFILSDLMIAEKRLEKIELNYKRGMKSPALQIEEKAIKRVIEALNSEIPLRDVPFPADEQKAIKGFMFLTIKPMMVILNSDEKCFGKSQKVLENISKIAPVYEIAGKFETELSRMEQADAQAFMDDMGISESAVDRVIKAAYNLQGLISFFTIGDDEVRAWTIQKGDNAVVAAGKIHSDMAKGFIRAEIFSYKDIQTYGSEKVLREKGLLRLEGKTYLVQNGDIIFVRFNI